MLLNKFPPMTWAAATNRVGVVDGGKDQHGRAARGVIGGPASNEPARQPECGFLRLRTGIPIDCGQSFQSIADSIPMIADSSPIDGF
jgi:hypothetical protein